MIINISGKQGSGKSTLMRALQKRLIDECMIVGHHRFSEVIYEMHDACRDVARSHGLEFPEKHGRLLQVIGTEAFREAIDEEYWIKATQKLVDRTLESGIDVVIIDDCRFPNELNAFDNNKYPHISVRLECPEEVRKWRAEGWRDNTDHPSETGLDDATFDVTFHTSKNDVNTIVSILVERIKKENVWSSYERRGAQNNG